MLRNYLKVAVRNFVNQKYYSLINSLGLALGIAACILILLFVQDELSYDSTFENNDQVYRLVQDFPMGEHLSKSATVPFPTKNAMLEDFPDITNAALIFRPSAWGNTPVITYEKEDYFEDDLIFAEPSFFEIYKPVFIKGNPKTALVGINEVVLTESIAMKYFGEDDPMGKVLSFGAFRDVEVTGVIEDLPANTHLQYSMVASFETYRSFFNNPAFFDTQWVWVAAWMYFTVEDESYVDGIREQLPDFIQAHYPEVLAEKGIVLHIQKANDVHLTSNRELEFRANSKIQHVYLFSSIAALILLIAVINFMNLSTSRSTKRAREVGLRKVMGAFKRNLITQFMGEAMLTSFLSVIIAFIMISLALPWYNVLTGKEINIDLFHNTALLKGLIFLGVFVGLAAGSYPSLIISSFKPTDVLKGKLISGSSGKFLRRVLVVGQFVISITLIICIGIVYKQLNYINKKDLGFDKEQIIMIDVAGNFFNQYEPFKTEILKKPEINAVSLMGGSIPGEEMIIENAYVPTGTPVEEQQWFSALFATHDFDKIIDVEFLEGHGFQVGNSVDSTGFIINEAAARALGWEGQVVGRSLDRVVGGVQTGEVIGLVKDFHYRPLYDPIKPLVIQIGGGTLAIKMETENIKGTLGKVEEQWNSQFEGIPFRFSFMDDNFESLYRKETKFSRTIQYFSILALFISCLGLLGLSSFATENRRKEIGIRKVNGASTTELLRLLTKDFSILILIAFIISIPVAYYFGNMWLSSFAYRTEIGIWIFLIAGLIAIILAMATVSYHTLKSALRNPVDALRYE
jgi:putative ABC transport system permease protein